MRVQDIMSRRPVTVGLDTTAAAALRLLGSHHVTALPVVDRSTRIVGIVSEADLIAGRVPADPVLRGAAAAGNLLSRIANVSVADVMSRLIVVVHPETDVAEAAHVFQEHGYKSLPVVDAADQVVGMVSRSDVVRALTRDDDTLAQDMADQLAGAGLPGFRVTVRHGVVQLHATDERHRSDLGRALELIAATPGVTDVNVC